MVDNTYIANKSTVPIIENPEIKTLISKNNSELLYGEQFAVEKDEGEFYFGTSHIDNYKGYVKKADLRKAEKSPTHFTGSLLTHLYPEPDYKTYPVKQLSMMSRLALEGLAENGYEQTECGHWIYAQHIHPIEVLDKNRDHNFFLKTIHSFLGTPYLYGGRSSLGIDCSGLVQVACLRSGITCPRDSGPQFEKLGYSVHEDEIQPADLIFFKGHVAIALTEKEIINATARTMQVCIENLDKVVDNYGKILGIKRISFA